MADRGCTAEPVLSIAAWMVVWLALAALGMCAVMQLHDGLRDLYFVLRVSRWAMALYDKTTIIVHVLLWLAFAVFSMDYFSKGAAAARLGQRAGVILGVEILLLGLSYGLKALVT